MREASLFMVDFVPKMVVSPLQEIVESLTGVHWALLDPNGIIVAVNPAWRAFSALNGGVGDYLGANYLEICARACQENDQLWEAERLLHQLRDHLEARAQDPSPSVCYSCHAPTEHRWFEVNIRPCAWEGNRHLLIVHRNVTTEKHLEFSRERALGMIMHDLRGQIGNLYNTIDLLQMMEQDPERRMLLSLSQKSGRRALEIIASHSRFIALEQGALHLECETLDLAAMIDGWRQRSDRQLGSRKIQLAVHADRAPAAPAPRGERTLIQSVLDNLLTNALEAAPFGGLIQVTLRIDSRGLHLSIHNPGAVPPEIRSRFFEKYVTHGKSHGTGLGTYTARLIVEAHRGTIRMRTPNENSTEILIFIPH